MPVFKEILYTLIKLQSVINPQTQLKDIPLIVRQACLAHNVIRSVATNDKSVVEELRFFLDSVEQVKGPLENVIKAYLVITLFCCVNLIQETPLNHSQQSQECPVYEQI